MRAILVSVDRRHCLAHFLACRWFIGKGGWAMLKRRTTTRSAGRIPQKSAVRANKSKPAKVLHWISFPNESASYRKARNALLTAEIELRRAIERVAAQRRKLPAGGVIPEDYIFEEDGSSPADAGTVRQVRLSELFEEKNTLVAYSFMYGPQMRSPCPMCTSMVDALNGNAEHIMQRTNLVLIAKSPMERTLAFADARGWTKLRILSSAGNSYNRDYQGEAADGSQLPSLNVFVRRNGRIRHFYNTELLFVRSEPGQNSRHIDMIWPLWNLLDFTPEGRGTTWYPKLSYAS
jgi:predicted dithiol-disulfide oxidoreductase (DUF899 family)